MRDSVRAGVLGSIVLSSVLGVCGALSAELDAPGPPTSPDVAPQTPAPEEASAVRHPLPEASQLIESWQVALSMAMAADPEYAATVADIDRASGAERQALAPALPTISGSGNVTFHLIQAEVASFDVETQSATTRTVPTSPVANASLAVRQAIVAPRVWWGIGTSQLQTEVVRKQVAVRKQSLVSTLAEAMVASVTSERQAEASRTGLIAAEDRLALQEKRQSLGVQSELDTVRFRQDVVAARGSYIANVETLTRARERLGFLFGQTQSVSLSPNFSTDEVVVALGRLCKKTELADRPDLTLQETQRRLQQRALTDADLMYLPTADLVTTLNLGSEPLVGDGHASFSVQGVLSVPIWDGGSRYGARRVAEATIASQTARIEGNLRSAKIELTQAGRAILVALESRKAASESRDLALRSAQLVEKAFVEGATSVTSLDMVDAARRLREADLALAVRDLELVRARIAAVLATSTCSF